jgi:hypothetical protein
MSATTRMVLDSVRTMTIWGFSLAGLLFSKHPTKSLVTSNPLTNHGFFHLPVGWETFQFMQIIGFVLLISGTFVYNGILIVPAMRKYGILKPKETK